MLPNDSRQRLTHNLKVTGSNPVPATKKYKDINYLQSAPRGAICVAKSPGSTAEARGCEILGNNVKTGISSQDRRDRPLADVRSLE